MSMGPKADFATFGPWSNPGTFAHLGVSGAEGLSPGHRFSPAIRGNTLTKRKRRRERP